MGDNRWKCLVMSNQGCIKLGLRCRSLCRKAGWWHLSTLQHSFAVSCTLLLTSHAGLAASSSPILPTALLSAPQQHTKEKEQLRPSPNTPQCPFKTLDAIILCAENSGPALLLPMTARSSGTSSASIIVFLCTTILNHCFHSKRAAAASVGGGETASTESQSPKSK